MIDKGFCNRTRIRAEATMRDHGIDPAPYADAIERYVSAAEMASYLRVQWEDEGSPEHSLGGNGNLTTHPSIKAITDAEAHAHKLADALGLTPESYARITRGAGRSMGQSQAPDRQLRRAA